MALTKVSDFLTQLSASKVTTRDILIPSSAIGDVQIAVVFGEIGSSTGYTFSDGDTDTWNKVGEAEPATGYEKVAIFWRIATASGSSYFTVSSDQAAYIGGVGLVFRGAHPSNPIPEYDTRVYSTSTFYHATNGLTPTVDGCYFVSGCVTEKSYAHSPEAGWTEEGEATNGSGSAHGTVCTKAQATAGFEACTVTTTGRTFSQNMLIYVQPAPPGPSFDRDGIAGASIDTVDGIAVADITDVDGIIG